MQKSLFRLLCLALPKHRIACRVIHMSNHAGNQVVELAFTRELSEFGFRYCADGGCDPYLSMD
jgi:hypothetical protein